MASKLLRAVEKNLIKPPGFVYGNLAYEVITGSYAYGVNNDNSDMDICGFCIPTKDIIFPHITGAIRGFDPNTSNFGQFQKHHVIDKEARKEYDFTIFSIIKFFKLCMDCNPNMIDTLFVSSECVLSSTSIGQLVRENRKLFLSKKAWHTFKGYAYQQLRKMKNKKPEEGSKRWELAQKHGYDTKFASHLLRLFFECEQILTEGDLDLRRNSQQVKAIREGQWTEQQVIDFYNDKERELEEVYNKSELPYKPRFKEIKALLLNCLEEAFGSLDNLVAKDSSIVDFKRELKDLIGRY